MGERLYQMKDLIERFGITRDTIKYYEKKCLLSPQRSESGYRMYTEEDVQKIKQILELKNMGFAIRDCEAQFAEENEATIDILDVVKKDIESEIRELSLKLQRLEKYKEHQTLKMATETGVRHAAGYSLCYGCEKLIEQYTKDCLVCDMAIFHMDDSGEILTKEETIGVMVSNLAKIDRQCPECSKKNVIKMPEIYVKFVPGMSEAELGNAVKKACKDAMEQGILPAEKIYCMKNLIRSDGNERIAFHIFVPQKK